MCTFDACLCVNLEMLQFFLSENWQWTEVETKGRRPPPLAAHGCAFIRRKLYVFGGLSPEGACDELYCLDTGEARIMAK